MECKWAKASFYIIQLIAIFQLPYIIGIALHKVRKLAAQKFHHHPRMIKIGILWYGWDQ